MPAAYLACWRRGGGGRPQLLVLDTKIADQRGGGGRPRLLVLDTKIVHRASDRALGLAEAGCSEVVEHAGESALWAEPWELFCSLPLLPPDGGAEEADPWDNFWSIHLLPPEGDSEDEPLEEEDSESDEESPGTKSRPRASARLKSLRPWSHPL